MKRLRLLAGLLAIVCLGISTVAWADNGITITPPLQDFVISNKPDNQIEIELINHTAKPASFSLTTEDFGSLDQSGGVIFINPNQHSKFGLAQFLSLPVSKVSLDAGQSAKVVINLLSAGIGPGGHYGAVLFHQIGPSNKNSVNATAVLASLIFAHKHGGEIYRLNLNSATIQKNWFHLPTLVSLKFNNSGNIHTVPRGVVRLSDQSGRVVAKGIINTDSSIILPEESRQLAVPLSIIKRAALPGRYHLAVDYRNDADVTVSHYRQTFWYVPVGSSVVLAALVLGIITLLVVIIAKLRR